MELHIHRLSLHLKHAFTISRSTRTTQESLIVELRDSGVSGWGEITPNLYYDQTIESLTQSLDAARTLLPEYSSMPPDQVWQIAMKFLKNNFTVCALDIAAHDWHARKMGMPIWEVWKLEPKTVPKSSYTIAIDSTEKMILKLREQPDWSIYKVKLGTDRDLEIVRALRSATTARLRVDANCAWTVQQTIDYSKQLRELGVEFIEQPLPAEAPRNDHRAVFLGSSLPIIADESCRQETDLEGLVGLFHGINIKLCKCGGLTPAFRMLRRARHLGLSTMIGCMLETSIGVSAAAQLLPLLDYADLDGSVLLADDPTKGIQVNSQGILLNDSPGHSGFLPI